MNFTGVTDAKIDAKGRVFLPSDYRKELVGAESKVVLRRDVYQPCVVIYPHKVWELQVEELRQRLNRWDSAQAMVFRQFISEAHIVNVDANGRILVPRRLLDACDIVHGVSFVGVDDRVELWSVQRIAESFLQPEDYAQRLSALMASPVL